MTMILGSMTLAEIMSFRKYVREVRFPSKMQSHLALKW